VSSTVHEPTARAFGASVSATFRVTVVDGPDRGRELLILPSTPGPIRLGTSTACDLVLSDRWVSRSHCAFEWHDGRLRIGDLDSTNGTVVNAVSVISALIGGGEVVKIGQTTLSVQVEASTAGAPAPVVPAEKCFGRFLGASPAIRRLYPLCSKLAQSNAPVIVSGETGSGKELLAECLHEASSRAAGSFVVFDTASVDSKAVDVALFGVEERSPKTLRKGCFEEADGGTILIDEVGDLSLTVQAKLLRVLERGEVCHVNGDRWLPVDVRVIASTRRDLEHEVELGRFREDLFYRLAVGRLELPPLRDRDDDAALLAAHFWRQMGRGAGPVPADLLVHHERYRWPGNVRELHNLVARRLALGPDDGTGGARAALPVAPAAVFDRISEMDLSLPEARARVVAEFERFYLERALARNGGSVARAAAASGIARRYFRQLKSKHVTGDKP
jgi:two-component system, NtrC family, response regulator HydG